MTHHLIPLLHSKTSHKINVLFFFFILSHAFVFNSAEDEDFSILLDALEGKNSSLNFPVSSGRTCERGYELVT